MITITAYTKSATDSETKICEKLSKMDEENRKLSRQVIYLLKELDARNGEIEALKAELEKVKSEAKVEDKAKEAAEQKGANGYYSTSDALDDLFKEWEERARSNHEPPKEAEREYISLSELAAVFDDLGKQFENLFNKHEG
jgi:hypothetical protein